MRLQTRVLLDRPAPPARAPPAPAPAVPGSIPQPRAAPREGDRRYGLSGNERQATADSRKGQQEEYRAAPGRRRTTLKGMIGER